MANKQAELASSLDCPIGSSAYEIRHQGRRWRAHEVNNQHLPAPRHAGERAQRKEPNE